MVRLLDIPPEEHSIDLYLSLIKEGRKPPYKWMLPELITDELYDLLITYDKDVVKDLPRRMLTPERIHRIITLEPSCICLLPWDLLTQGICDYAISLDGGVYNIIPDMFKTAENTVHAFTTCLCYEDDVPEKYRTPDLCKKMSRIH